MQSNQKNILIAKIIAGIIAAGGVLFFSFTPFYGIAYLILILVTASKFTSIRSFSTYVSRFILAGLILGASIMIAGLIVWLAGIQLFPLVVVLLYLILFLVSTRIFSTKAPIAKSAFIDRSDWISAGVSIIAPVILLLSFGTSAASMLQIANEGWDNGSHVLMLQDAGIQKGYLYGDSKTLGDKVVYYDSNAYPQAWHLATANILNGFGSENVFNPAKPVRTTYVYVFTVITWLIIASFVVTKISLFVARGFTRRKLSSPWEYFIFIGVALFFQMVVLWGSFNSGFSNFIGMLTYISILIACLLDIKNNPKAGIIGAIAGVAAALCWFLPLPAIAITLILALALSLNIKSFRAAFKNKGALLTLCAVLVPAAIITLGQVLIFVLFSRISGADQLNEGVAISATSAVNGVFPVSQILFVLATAFTLWYWFKYSNRGGIVALALIPFIVFVIGIYAFQEVTSGYTSYYLSKIMGVAFLILGIFAAPAFTFWVFDMAAKLRVKSGFVTFGAGAIVLGLVILFSNQSLYGASHLLERNTRVNKNTEVAVIDFLRNAQQKKQDIIVMRNDPNKPSEDRNGRFEMRVVHKKLTCAYTVRNAGAPIEEWVERLGNCAKRLAKQGRTITVITSERTTQAIRALNAWNIKIVEVRDEKASL